MFIYSFKIYQNIVSLKSLVFPIDNKADKKLCALKLIRLKLFNRSKTTKKTNFTGVVGSFCQIFTIVMDPNRKSIKNKEFFKLVHT